MGLFTLPSMNMRAKIAAGVPTTEEQLVAAAAAAKPRERPELPGSQRLPIPMPKYVDDSFDEEFRSVKAAFKGQRNRYKEQRTWKEWLAFFLPCFEWLFVYDVKKQLSWDLLAGVSVGFMVVPQSMAYASLAGMPAVWGLYGAFIPILMYSVFGSSRQLSVGPVAVTSLLIGNGVKKVVPGASFIDDPNNLDSFQVTVQRRYNKTITQLAFLVAILYTLVGVLRLGFLLRFLSHPVTTGFTSGAAIIIGMSQVRYMLGMTVPRKDTLQEQIAVLVAQKKDYKPNEALMGMCMLIMILAFMQVSRRWPKLFWLRSLGPMTAAILGIIVVAIAQYNYLGAPIKVVLNIPRGLPKVTVKDWLPLQYSDTLVPLAFVVMMVDMLESTTIARALARKNGYKLIFNREIVGLGVANFFGAAFNAYTATGSFSLSSVNNASGARTQLSGLVTSMIVMFVLLFLTPMFALMPYNTMAAIIIASCTTLFEWRVARQLWKSNLRDFCCWLAALLGVVFGGVQLGLCVAIALSLFLYVLETAFPHLAILGRVDKTDLTISTRQYPVAQQVPGVLALRMDAPIYFGNVTYLEDKVDTFVEEAEVAAKEGKEAPLEFLILDLTPSSHIDSSGCHTIGTELALRLRKKGIQVVLAGPNPKVLRVLERCGVLDEVGRHWVFSNVADAVDACVATPRLVVDGGSAVSDDKPGSSSSADLHIDYDTIRAGSKDVHSKER